MVARTSRLAQLEAENEALKRAIEQLHRIANLLRESLDVEAACDAVLTAVTAGVGLGFNRAMLFLTAPDAHDELRGHMALGPADEAEADRVWRAIEAGQADLETLYQHGREARRLRGRPGWRSSRPRTRRSSAPSRPGRPISRPCTSMAARRGACADRSTSGCGRCVSR